MKMPLPEGYSEFQGFRVVLKKFLQKFELLKANLTLHEPPGDKISRAT